MTHTEGPAPGGCVPSVDEIQTAVKMPPTKAGIPAARAGLISTDVAVEFEGVCKAYPQGPLGWGRRPVLRAVTFRLGLGEVVGLVGPNRAGKTTLAKVLLSLCHP